MAWSPLGGGYLGGGAHRVLPSQEGYRDHRVLGALDAMANHYGVDRSCLALSWLLKHPSGMIPIIGSLQPDRIQAAVRAMEVPVSREDWYRLLIASRGEPLP